MDVIRNISKSGIDRSDSRDNALPHFLVDILNSREFRHVMTDVSQEFITRWSNDSRIKQRMGGVLNTVLSKVMTPNGDKHLNQIFASEEFLETLSQELPSIMNAGSSILLSMVHAVEALPRDKKITFFDRLFASLDMSLPGQVLTSVARTAEEIYKDDPVFFSSRLTPALDKLIAGTDFGELEALYNVARTDIETFMRNAAGLLFEYPAKLVTALSLAPDGANLVLTIINDLLGHFNTLPPDILTDILLSLFKQVDAKIIGKSLNRANELIRQIHTGSTLIGDMDAPRFSTDLKDKVREFMAEIDPVLAIKARNALIDGRETVISTLIDSTEDHPELLNLWLNQLAVKRNSDIRLFKRKINVFETLPEDDAIKAMYAGLSNWNAYDLAEVTNTLSRMLNRIHGFNTSVIKTLVTEYVNSLDPYELEESLSWMIKDLGEAVRPVFRMAAPHVIREVCGFFTPGESDDGYDDEMDKARDLLRQFILNKENAS